MRIILALLSGSLFGAGLALSGMDDPMRVRAFLDLLGPWDPTLAFVMGGAMIPMALAWIVQKRIERPIADQQFNLPETTGIDGKLALGAILFGIGWGIGGLCPGPALASLALAPAAVAPFVLAMLGGMALHRVTLRP
ncbi:YeeE/YedE family protein [Sphingomonas sp. HH69]